MKIRNCKWAVLWLLVVTIPLLTIGTSHGQAIRIVSPSGLVDTEGDTGLATPITPFRTQQLYLAEDFGSMPAGGGFIIGHSIRADVSARRESTDTFADSVFTLSTTSRNSLEDTFDNNFGNDAQVVFDGSTSISYPISGPSEGPHPFGANVEYQFPFFYDPSLGNLLVEHISTSGSDVPSALKDWQDTTTVTVAFGDSNALTADRSANQVIVRQFTIIPEPSTLLLTIIGMTSTGSFRRRR